MIILKKNTEVHAVFSSVYNEYKVSIYEQLKERLVEEKIYHYGDIIDYPVLRKKGTLYSGIFIRKQ